MKGGFENALLEQWIPLFSTNYLIIIWTTSASHAGNTQYDKLRKRPQKKFRCNFFSGNLSGSNSPGDNFLDTFIFS